MRERRLVVHHFDPLAPGLGGIDTCIRGLVRFSRSTRFAFVATDTSGEQPRGRWLRREVAESQRSAATCYVASSGGTRERIPNGLRLAAGAAAHARTIRRAHPDVVQVHRPEIALIARRLFPDARLDLFVHEDATNWTGETSGSHWTRALPRYLAVQKRAVEATDRVVSFSPTAAERLAELHDDVLSVPTWFDPERFQVHPAAEATTGSVLWIGRLEAVKDPLLALETLERLPDDHRLTMVGAGSIRAEIEGEVQRRRLRDRVDLVGQVDKDEIAALMRAHALLLMTSHSEGFPRALVETLASGSADPQRCRTTVADRAAPDVVRRILT
ncbi:MAG: glycosyltransferase family 4 protein [Nitriliruptoraceae bacterium]